MSTHIVDISDEDCIVYVDNTTTSAPRTHDRKTTFMPHVPACEMSSTLDTLHFVRGEPASIDSLTPMPPSAMKPGSRTVSATSLQRKDTTESGGRRRSSAQEYPSVARIVKKRYTEEHDTASDSEMTDGSQSHGTSASSAQNQARNAGVTRFKICGKELRVSFVTWTVVAMCVPILFLIGATANAAATAGSQLVVVNQLTPLAPAASECITAIVEEQYRTIRYVIQPSTNASTAMKDLRLDTNAKCLDVFQTALTELAVADDYFKSRLTAWQLAAGEIAVIRSIVDLALPNATGANLTKDARNTLRSTVTTKTYIISDAVTNAVARAADKIESKDARSFIDLKLIADARKMLWDPVIDGFVVAISVNDSADVLADHTARFLANRDVAYEALDDLQQISTPFLRDQLNYWNNRGATKTFRRLADQLATTPALVNSETWFERGRTTGINLRIIETNLVQEIKAARAATSQVYINVTIAVVGVAVCVFAASLLSWHQLRTKAELEAQVERAERTRQAVSAFVPRFFLRKMGYTSITQVHVGESTDVALAMLFADVRRFTTVAEGMTSSQLFAWVQGYFKRMTTIVDSHHGNVNQFVGDALFAVFSTCRDAVRCGIAMQSDAQQLNVERLCEERNDVSVDIGVGLHHDVLAMGILGDEHRHTCTAISASVNLASRLEGLTKQLGCRILASEAVISQLSPSDLEALSYRRVGEAVVKGSSKEVTVFDIFQTDDRALQHYKTTTKEEFEEYARQYLQPSASKSPSSRAAIATLADQLKRRAAELEVVDATLEQLEVYRDDATGLLVFDDK